jgi:hypothetical protein
MKTELLNIFNFIVGMMISLTKNVKISHLLKNGRLNISVNIKPNILSNSRRNI